MPVIPSYVNRQGAQTSLPGPNASLNAFYNPSMENAARSAERALGVVEQFAEQVVKDKKRENDLETVNILSQNPFDEEYLAVKQDLPENGEGFVDAVRRRNLEYKDRVLSMTENRQVRRDLEARINEQSQVYLRNAANEQYKMRNVYEEKQTNASLSALQNGVVSDPGRYDLNLSLGRELIQNAAIENDKRGVMAEALQQSLAASRFDGMLARAKTPEEVENIRTDFSQERWASELKAQDFERITRQIEDKRNGLAVKLDAEGSAFISMAEKRTADYVQLDPSSKAELSAMVRRYPGSKVSINAAQVLRNQTFLESNGDKTLPELRQVVSGMREGAQQSAKVPRRLSDAVTAVVASGEGSVTPAYLLAVAQAEYGAELSKGDAADFGKRTTLGNNSSTGVYQFIDKTWLELMKDQTVTSRFGINVQGKTDEQLLSLRSSPETSAAMALVLAERNKAALERSLSRPVSDVDLYVAHFLGQGKATEFLATLQTKPYAQASTIIGNEMEQNRIPKEATVKQVYDMLAHKMGTSNASVAYNDLVYAQGLLSKAEKASKEGTLLEYYIERHPGEQVVQPLNPADPNTFADRGVQVEKVARLQGVPVSRVKPLLPAEVDTITQQLEEATADNKISILSNFTRMGGAAQKAFEQLGEKAPVVGYAASLAVLGGQKDTAKDILNGYERIQKDKTAKAMLGEEKDRLNAFIKTAGEAFDYVEPKAVSAVREATNAHYVERNRSKTTMQDIAGGTFSFGSTEFTDAYGESVKAVVSSRLSEYNGRQTILPQGVSAEDIGRFFSSVGPFDLMNFNAPPTGMPKGVPVDSRGRQVTLYDLHKEGQIALVDDDHYIILMGDKKPLALSNPNGLPIPYVIKLDKNIIDQVNGRGRLMNPDTLPTPWYLRPLEGVSAIKG